jgi:hypothetical protein
MIGGRAESMIETAALDVSIGDKAFDASLKHASQFLYFERELHR